MPSSLNALLSAWAVSLIIVVGGVLFFEVTHDPDAAETEQAANQPNETASTVDEDTANPASAQAQDVPDSGRSNTETDTATNQPALQGQDPDTGLARSDLSGEPPQEPARVAQIAGGVRVEADPGLIEQSNLGPLPRVSNEGAKSYEVYAARRSNTQGRSQIALIITELGMRSAPTRRALADLPPAVTLAFSPYGENLIATGEQARRMGHEVLLMVPMEPSDYPQNDPGPFTLLTKWSPRENVNLLKATLANLTGYVGIVNHMGSRFTAATESLRPVMEEVQRRGLMFVDSRSTRYSRAANMAKAMGVPVAVNNAYIDENLTPEVIARQLEALENQARVTGYAVGMGRPYRVTIDAVKIWVTGLEDRGFELVPITAVANRQPLPR